MKSKLKKYIVVERKSRWKTFDFINDDTTGLDDIWHTSCPYKINEDEKDRLRPLIFDNRSEAVKYKDTQQSYSDYDWGNNGYYYKMHGKSKPKWKVEEYNGQLFR